MALRDVIFMRRREFIKQVATAGTASVIIGGGILLIGSRSGKSKKALKIYKPKDYKAKIPSDKPVLAIAKNKDYRKAVATAIAVFGGMETFIKTGDYVCLKPNIGWDRSAQQGANTHPEVVAELGRLCFKAGAKKVIVVDVTCNAPRRCYNRSGIKAAAQAEGIEVIIPDDSLFEHIDFGNNSLGKWQVLKPVLECDKLINVPVVKHHSLSGMTASMKNWFGVLTGPRNRLHQDIHDNIAELAYLFQPTLVVEDVTRVLQRNGPQGGKLEDLITYDSVVVSTDQVAAEAYVTRFLDKKPADFPFIGIAENKGVGISQPPSDKVIKIDV
ncbi:MAG: hypothetical protein B6D58_00810 [candidate division Zixibacteria bacterium 4484_95]|nr:MAG: hypothetical protein B6D58_00810 [candidate division Zixibacteria bacterium 4484_95]